MGKQSSETGLGWRLLWGLVGAGLTFTVLSVSGLDLSPPLMAGITVAAGIAVAWVGPALLDLLNLV
jgi:hypothetical protein